jgi:hypothetical protein
MKTVALMGIAELVVAINVCSAKVAGTYQSLGTTASPTTLAVIEQPIGGYKLTLTTPDGTELKCTSPLTPSPLLPHEPVLGMKKYHEEFHDGSGAKYAVSIFFRDSAEVKDKRMIIYWCKLDSREIYWQKYTVCRRGRRITCWRQVRQIDPCKPDDDMLGGDE